MTSSFLKHAVGIALLACLAVFTACGDDEATGGADSGPMPDSGPSKGGSTGGSGSAGTGGSTRDGGSAGADDAVGGSSDGGDGDAEPDAALDAGNAGEAGDSSGSEGNGGAGGGEAEAASPCGNGTVDDDEECDDGNTTDGDGCSSYCTSSCETCWEEECPEQVDPCFKMEGVATAGLAAGSPRSELCADVMRCVWETNCARVDVAECYCGSFNDVPLNDCLQGAADGPCKEEFEYAAESTDPADVQERISQTQFALGAAGQLVLCNQFVCADPCFRVVCGDGFVSGDETCDDGNMEDGDDCPADCME